MENNINKTFSNNLKKLLSEKKATQLQLANYLGVSNTTINNYVKGYNMPRMDKVDDIAKFFNVKREDLISSKEVKMATDYFTNAQEAMNFLLNQTVIMGFNGLDITKLTEEEQVDYANEVLEMMKLVSLKYKK